MFNAMRWVGLLSVLYVIVPMAPSALSGEPPSSASAAPENLSRLLNDPSHLKTIQAAAIDGFSKALDCAEGKFESTGPVSFYNPLKIDENGHVLSGLVSERGRVIGCGKTMIVNIATGNKDGSNSSVFQMPGTTHANPTLTHDTFGYVYRAATPKIGDCKKVRFINSEFVEFFGAPNPSAKFQNNGGRPWREVWTIDICGQQQVRVPVEYIPNDKGTVISVEFVK